MAKNAAGLDACGANNPNWKGGPVNKVCEVCSVHYTVRRAQAASRFCSLQCVGVAQRKAVPQWSMEQKVCEECAEYFYVPASHAHRSHCCSRACQSKRHSRRQSGSQNANWNGGLSRLPYPWNFREISRRVIARDGYVCQGPECGGSDRRLTTHHINYQKSDCRDENLIALCSSCNSKANFGRERWEQVYTELLAKKHGGGWDVEEF